MHITGFPQIVDYTTEFIKQHGYSAHNRRRNEVGIAGVTFHKFRSPMSKKLNSVRFPANAQGDDRPPCSIPNISSEELQKKEFEVFNNALSTSCNAYWKGAVFNNNEVCPVPIL